MSRAYDNSKRRLRAAETRQRITTATEALLYTTPIAEITLQRIARAAGTTVQTVLRHLGSRDGVFEAVAADARVRFVSQREESEPGDIDGAIDGLLTHYEAEGSLVLNLLGGERDGDPMAARYSELGRTYHRAWVERCFRPASPEITDALVVATDLYVWKLLRLDLKRPLDATTGTITRLVRSVLESS